MVYAVDAAGTGGHLSRTEAYMGLTVTRKIGESLLLTIAPGTTAEELFEQLQAGLSIRVVWSCMTKAQIDVTAPAALRASRPEQHEVTP